MKRNIYLISSSLDDKTIYKIGHTKRSVEKRVNDLKTGNPYEFNIVEVYVANAFGISIETKLHKHFEHKKINREWFELSESDIAEFPDLCDRFYALFELLSTNTYILDSGKEFK